jgi:hypothetical protein
MTNIFLKITVFLVIFSTMGCAPVYYKPNLMNVPNFREKDEAFAAIHLSDNGFDWQVAYAVTDHIGVQANYMAFIKARKDDGTGQNKTNSYINKSNITEGAIGYFSPLNKICNVGLYGGYGVGNIKNNWQLQGASSVNFSKLFIQPSIGLKLRNIELIFAAKLGQLNYDNPNHNYLNSDFIVEFAKLKDPMTFVETSYTFRFGFEQVKFQLQATTLNHFNTKFAGTSYETGTFGAGMCMGLNTRKLK